MYWVDDENETPYEKHRNKKMFNEDLNELCEVYEKTPKQIIRQAIYDMWQDYNKSTWEPE